jgi:hypothetical protein
VNAVSKWLEKVFARADLVRWKDADGNMVAMKALNTTLYRMIGKIDYTQTDPNLRAVIDLPTAANAAARKLEDRTFKATQRYLPIPQSELDKNPQLIQNDGY